MLVGEVRSQRGFGILESMIAMGVIVIAAVAAINLALTCLRSAKDLQAQTMWRVANLQVDFILRDTLTCEKTNLVLPGDANRIQAGIVVPPGEFLRDITAVEVYGNPAIASTKRTLLKVGEGNKFFTVTRIFLEQAVVPIGLASYRQAVPISMYVEGKLRDSRQRDVSYKFDFNIDVDPISKLAESCYGGSSWRRVCEQLGRTYQPTITGATICS